MRPSIAFQTNTARRAAPQLRPCACLCRFNVRRRRYEQVHASTHRVRAAWEEHPLRGPLSRSGDVDVGDDYGGEAAVLRKALGVDYGQKFTGIAISAGGTAPRPLKVIATQNPWHKTAMEVVEISVQEQVEGIVVGMPVTLQGNILDRNTDSQQGRRCRNFGLTLASIAARKNLRVYLFDERFSTQSAFGSDFDDIIAEHTKLSSRDGYPFGVRGSRWKKKLRKGNASSSTHAKDRVDAQAAASILKEYYGNSKAAILVKP